MLNWRIYYGDGSTFSSADGAPQDAPALNVQVIVQRDPDVGRALVSGHHYYWFHDSEWYGGNDAGWYQYLFWPGYKIVKFGTTMGNRAFIDIVTRAGNDPDFPPKSARLKSEQEL